MKYVLTAAFALALTTTGWAHDVSRPAGHGGGINMGRGYGVPPVASPGGFINLLNTGGILSTSFDEHGHAPFNAPLDEPKHHKHHNH